MSTTVLVNPYILGAAGGTEQVDIAAANRLTFLRATSADRVEIAAANRVTFLRGDADRVEIAAANRIVFLRDNT